MRVIAPVWYVVATAVPATRPMTSVCKAHRARRQRDQHAGRHAAQLRGRMTVDEHHDGEGDEQRELDPHERLGPAPSGDPAAEDDRERDAEDESQDGDGRTPCVPAVAPTERDPQEHRVPALVRGEDLEDAVEVDRVDGSGDQGQCDREREVDIEMANVAVHRCDATGAMTEPVRVVVSGNAERRVDPRCDTRARG